MLQELICSNGIHAGLVVGDSKSSPNNLSFEPEWFKVYKDDKIITKAKASVIMGGPKLINISEDTKLIILIEKVGKAITYFKS